MSDGYTYFGTSDFAAQVLRGLVADGWSPDLVVCPPPRRKGRGRKQSPAPAAQAASELDLTLLETADVNSADVRSRVSGSDTGLVCAFGQIFREPLLSELMLLNVHPSDLPRWRGAAPIERAIIAGDAVTAVCIIRLEEGLDSGPVAAKQEEAIADSDDFGSLSTRLAETAVKLAASALAMAREDSLRFEPQSDEGVTYAERIESSERVLSPHEGSQVLARTVRALTPHIGAGLDLGEHGRLGVLRARPVEAHVGASVGTLQAVDGEIELTCGSGALRIEEVKPAGGRAMSAGEYVRGHSLPEAVPG